MRDIRERLLDILEAIARIERYVSRGKEDFEHDELVQVWMVAHIQVIGEACRALPDSLQRHYPDVPWRAIVGMRNILVHHYFEVDLEAVWQVVERDLPMLKQAMLAIVEDLQSGEQTDLD